MTRALACCTLAWGIAACQTLGTPISPEFSVVSLREIFPSLEQEAREWQADAYLTEVDISLKEHTSRSVVAYAGFQSPSAGNQSLLVTLQSDDSVSSEIIAHELPVIQADPIVPDDSVLESADALELALALANPSSPSLVGSGCSFLTLERAIAVDPSRVVWRLTLAACSSPDTEYISIDARTGARVPYP